MKTTTTAPSDPPQRVDETPLRGQTVHVITTSAGPVPASYACPVCWIVFSVPRRIADHTFCPSCHAFLR